MSDVTPYPISNKSEDTTGGAGYMVAEALYLATKWIDQITEGFYGPA